VCKVDGQSEPRTTLLDYRTEREANSLNKHKIMANNRYMNPPHSSGEYSVANSLWVANSCLQSHCRGELLLRPFIGYVMNETIVDLGFPFCASRNSPAHPCREQPRVFEAANLPRMELADGLNYGTADCALRSNVVATADRRPGTLSSEHSNEPANSRLLRTIHQSQSKRKPKHIWLLTTAGFNIHTARYVSSRTPLRL